MNTTPATHNKAAAVVLALLLGTLGIHQFYLNNAGHGIAYLLITLFLFFVQPLAIIWLYLVLLIDIILIAASDSQKFKPQPIPLDKLPHTTDYITRLSELNNLRLSGALTEDEFAAEKAKLKADEPSPQADPPVPAASLGKSDENENWSATNLRLASLWDKNSENKEVLKTALILVGVITTIILVINWL